MSRGRVAMVISLILLLALAAYCQSTPAKDAVIPHHSPIARASTAQPRAMRRLGITPLRFEENQGQFDSRVRFLAREQGYQVFLTSDSAVLSLQRFQSGERSGDEPDPSQRRIPKLAAATALAMTLLGAHPLQLTGLDQLPTRTNYFLGNDPQRWRSNVPNFARVRYEQAYPGIDVVYYAKDGRLEYDFVVAPGADPSKIGLQVAGADKVALDGSKDLVIETAAGALRLAKPVIYQDTPQGRRTIAGGFALRGDRVTFQLGAYDHSAPLVIDPVLLYSTYLGGSSSDGPGLSITVDSTGAAFVAGQTQSTDFPATLGSLQPGSAGGGDAFVTKFDPAGDNVVYSTYLGGTSNDNAIGVRVDGSGNAYVIGGTQSSNFPTTGGALRTSFVGSNDGFVAKLSADGATLLYSTLISGTTFPAACTTNCFLSTFLEGMAINGSGEVFLAGGTDTGDLSTVGAFQTAVPGGEPTCCGAFHAFVAELNSAGSAFVYATYLTGAAPPPSTSAASDEAIALALDSSGNVYVAGFAQTVDFPTTGGAFQTTNPTASSPGQNSHGFVSKLNSTGSALLYSTYIGGTKWPSNTCCGADFAEAIAVDTSGNAYVAGPTGSVDYPTTVGAFQTAFGKSSCICETGFITKLNASGSALVYSTFLGGSSTNGDGPIGIALDSTGVAYVTGVASSADFPLVLPIQSTRHGNQDAFVAALNSSGSALVYSTFLGGSTNSTSNPFSQGLGIALDSSNNAYVSGVTSTTDFPITPGAFQATYGGSNDTFLVKVGPANAPGVAFTPQSLTFGSIRVGLTSTQKSFSLKNVGSAALNISSVVANGDFIDSSGCGSSLAAGTSCSIAVAFAPTQSGSRTGSIAITDDAATSPQTILLSGTGLAPIATLSSNSLSFASQQVGTASGAQTVTVTNTGTATLNISSVIPAGDFGESDNCVGAIAEGAHCTISVTFTPTAGGSRVGSVTINDDAVDTPQVIALGGTGYTTTVSLSSTSIPFADQRVGTTSATQPVTLTNTGSGSLGISNIATSGDFSQTNNCPASLTGGAFCTINVAFTPSATGARSGSLTISDDGLNAPHVVALSGNGIASAVSLTATSLTFANTAVGSTTATQQVTLTNTGTDTLNISSIASSSGDFTQTNNCPATVAISGTCIINIAFAPQAAGARAGSVLITDDAPASPQSIDLTGTGLAPGVQLSTTSLTFSGQPVGSTSASQPVTLTNNGTATLTINTIAANGDFAQTNNCGASLAASASCTINVTFTPAVFGTRQGSVTITDNAAGNPNVVTLSGTGVDFTLSAAPNSATINAGQSTTVVVTVTPEGGSYTNPVSIACTALPPESTCMVSPTSVTPGANPATVNVTISTTAPTVASAHPFGSRVAPVFAVVLPLGFVCIGFRRRRSTVFLVIVALLLLAGLLAGCGGSSATTPNLVGGTTKGTYTITLDGSATGEQRTVPFGLTVQ